MSQDKTKKILDMMVGTRPTKAFVKPGCLNCERAVCDECGTENFEHDIDKMRDVYMTPSQRAAYNRLVELAKQQVIGTPRVHATFETKDGEITGSQPVDVLRVERYDDGVIGVVLDYWPSVIVCNAIERDDEMRRDYIPLPGGWEVQTKGAGSTFRIANAKTGDRLAIPESPYLHETLELMAREINAAVRQETK